MTSQLLNPPKPPTLHETGCLLLASSGFYIRLHEDGSASLVDGIQDVTLADFTSAEIEDIAYNLSNKLPAARYAARATSPLCSLLRVSAVLFSSCSASAFANS